MEYSQLHDDKAPDNDDYSTLFFTHAWDIVGDDFVKVVQKKFHYVIMIREVNATCITLVPKVEDPM